MASIQDDGENIGQIRFPTFTRDLKHTFDIPEDGVYTLRLEHLYGQVQGGPQYVYRLVVRPEPAPDFRLIVQPPHEIRAIRTSLPRRSRADRHPGLPPFGPQRPDYHRGPRLAPGRHRRADRDRPRPEMGHARRHGASVMLHGEAEIQIVGTSEGRGQAFASKARRGDRLGHRQYTGDQPDDALDRPGRPRRGSVSLDRDARPSDQGRKASHWRSTSTSTAVQDMPARCN